MGNNQFLSIGAIALLALISLRFNNTVLETKTTEIENKVYLTAFSLADDLLEEIKQKAFDEQTVEWKAIKETNLSPYESFGTVDPGEYSVNDFDDIDDYDQYSKSVSLPHAENYSVTSTVDYVTEGNQNITSATQTFFKRVTINVASPYMSHSIKLSFIFTLHSK
jgi:hypothetical protein